MQRPAVLGWLSPPVLTQKPPGYAENVWSVCMTQAFCGAGLPIPLPPGTCLVLSK